VKNVTNELKELPGIRDVNPASSMQFDNQSFRLRSR